MPTWCRYCHKDGHTKYECKKSRASILCFTCDQFGHRQAECPNPRNAKSKLRPPKKARKTPSIDNEMVINPSVELLKSKYAPNKSNQDTQDVPSTILDIEFPSDNDDEEYHPDKMSDEGSDFDMEDRLPPTNTTFDNAEQLALERYSDDMNVDWSQTPEPSAPLSDNSFQHLLNSPSITPSRTQSLRLFVSDPLPSGTDPNNIPLPKQ